MSFACFVVSLLMIFQEIHDGLSGKLSGCSDTFSAVNDVVINTDTGHDRNNGIGNCFGILIRVASGTLIQIHIYFFCQNIPELVIKIFEKGVDFPV